VSGRLQQSEPPSLHFDSPDTYDDGFPSRLSPTVPDGPIGPYQALYFYSNFLTTYELTEILRYPRIFYLGHLCRKAPVNLTDRRSFGFADADGHYRISVGDHIAYRFEIRGFLGKGRHAQVVKCYDHERQVEVAVKLKTNSDGAFEKDAVERTILRQLKATKCPTIAMADLAFTFRNHFCITFEILGKDAAAILRVNGIQELSSRVVRCIAQDAVQAINAYHSCQIIHACITPANVVHVPGSNAQFQLIDFSHACTGEFLPQGCPLDIPDEYCPPEVVLELPVGIGLDMWCLGCMIVHLLSGKLLFSGKDRPNRLSSFATLMGLPSPEFIATWPNGTDLINPDTGWLFKEDLVDEKPQKSVSLRSFVDPSDTQLCDFLAALFTWEADKRMSPEEALNHPWIANREARIPLPG
jgi:dual specificity tyrosine-phosphorylation-regulated kinase 2/3/4